MSPPRFIVDKFVGVVFFRKAFDISPFVFKYAPFQIVGNSDIEDTVLLVGEDVDTIGPLTHR